jgi:hypothetical protein
MPYARKTRDYGDLYLDLEPIGRARSHTERMRTVSERISAQL